MLRSSGWWCFCEGDVFHSFLQWYNRKLIARRNVSSTLFKKTSGILPVQNKHSVQVILLCARLGKREQLMANNSRDLKAGHRLLWRPVGKSDGCLQLTVSCQLRPSQLISTDRQTQCVFKQVFWITLIISVASPDSLLAKWL